MNRAKKFYLLVALTISFFLSACTSTSIKTVTSDDQNKLHEKRIFELQKVKERLSKHL